MCESNLSKLFTVAGHNGVEVIHSHEYILTSSLLLKKMITVNSCDVNCNLMIDLMIICKLIQMKFHKVMNTVWHDFSVIYIFVVSNANVMTIINDIAGNAYHENNICDGIRNKQIKNPRKQLKFDTYYGS